MTLQKNYIPDGMKFVSAKFGLGILFIFLCICGLGLIIYHNDVDMTNKIFLFGGVGGTFLALFAILLAGLED